MKRYIKNLIKYVKPIYKFYYWLGNLIIKLLGFFININNKQILFVSYGGRKYDGSPKILYEKIINDNRFENYEIIWAFEKPEKHHINRGGKVKIDTIKYFIIALKSGIWITNSSIERGLEFKKNKTFCLNTWHGTPIKKMGIDIHSNNKSFKSKSDFSVDNFTVQGEYGAKIFSRVFNINYDKMLFFGLPRNDILVNCNDKDKYYKRKKIGVPLDKKIILYTPTYREYNKDNKMNCIEKPPIDFELWKKEIGNEYVVLLRAHYEVTRLLNVPEYSDFIYDVSDYDNLNDLMIVSDILISDYSSIFFDYSILEKPMITYAYDYNKYIKKRGMYFDIREEISSVSKETELLNLLKNLNYDAEVKNTKLFRNKYVEYYGNAANQVVDLIYKKN